jgi:hypothetical protein
MIRVASSYYTVTTVENTNSGSPDRLVDMSYFEVAIGILKRLKQFKGDSMS